MLANGHAQTTTPPGLLEAVRALETALQERDMEAALSAWRFETSADRAAEEAALRAVFSDGQIVLKNAPPSISADGRSAATRGTLARITEPRGSFEQWGLLWSLGEDGWRVVAKQIFGGLDSLVHLTMDPRGYVAAGQTIELEDFTLKMLEGTFFLNTQEAGPTALVFVGKGRVTFTPRPTTERGQMKLFAGQEVLSDDVSRAFLRLHPADLYRTLRPGSFADDPRSGERLQKATEYFERHKGDGFVLDAPIPGAPWWLLPGLGDAAIAFDTRKFGSLTLALSSAETEGVNLFNRSSRRQISAYPRADARPPTREEERALDVIHHDVTLSVNPESFELVGSDTIAMDLRSPVASIRFQLDDDLQVRSVRSTEGGAHLFFRVRGQNSVLVSMGSLMGRTGRLNLTVDYAGQLQAGTVDSEMIQAADQIFSSEDSPRFFIEPALIYTRRHGFYPNLGAEDYATSKLSVTVPRGWSVVAGGVRTEKEEADSTTITHTQGEDAKYIAFMVARLGPVASERTEALSFDVYSQSRARRDASRAAEALKSATPFFTRLFGPLPYSPLALAVVEAAVPGGHSPAGLLILQQRPVLMRGALKDDPATFYEIPGFFLAHELAHQWWGHAVTPRTYRDRWLSEGFAQYAAALWTRQSQGDEVFTQVLKKMAAWAKRLGSAGPVDLGNRVGHIQNNAQAHRAVVYDKGAMVLDTVRRLIGDDAFQRGLARLQRENRFGKIDTEMARLAFEAEGATDLSELFEVFVRNTTLPTVRLETKGDAREIVVEGYNGPLPLVVRVRDQRLNLIVTGRLKVPGAGPGIRVDLDPDRISIANTRR